MKDWKPYVVAVAAMAFVVSLANFGRAVEWAYGQQWFPASHGFVAGSTSILGAIMNSRVDEVLAKLNETTLQTLDNKLSSLDTLESMALARQRSAKAQLDEDPANIVAQDAFDQANDDLRRVDRERAEANCSIRMAKGLGCGS